MNNQKTQSEEPALNRQGDSGSVCNDLLSGLSDSWKVVSAEMLDDIQREAKRIMKGRDVQDPLWQFGYEIGRLAFDSRNDRLARPFFDRVCKMFGAVTRKEKEVVSRAVSRVLDHDGNYWLGAFGERSAEQRIQQAEEMFRDGSWRKVTHPKTVVRLDAMLTR